MVLRRQKLVFALVLVMGISTANRSFSEDHESSASSTSESESQSKVTSVPSSREPGELPVLIEMSLRGIAELEKSVKDSIQKDNPKPLTSEQKRSYEEAMSQLIELRDEMNALNPGEGDPNALNSEAKNQLQAFVALYKEFQDFQLAQASRIASPKASASKEKDSAKQKIVARSHKEIMKDVEKIEEEIRDYDKKRYVLSLEYRDALAKRLQDLREEARAGESAKIIDSDGAEFRKMADRMALLDEVLAGNKSADALGYKPPSNPIAQAIGALTGGIAGLGLGPAGAAIGGALGNVIGNAIGSTFGSTVGSAANSGGSNNETPPTTQPNRPNQNPTSNGQSNSGSSSNNNGQLPPLVDSKPNESGLSHTDAEAHNNLQNSDSKPSSQSESSFSSNNNESNSSVENENNTRPQSNSTAANEYKDFNQSQGQSQPQSQGNVSNSATPNSSPNTNFGGQSPSSTSVNSQRPSQSIPNNIGQAGNTPSSSAGSSTNNLPRISNAGSSSYGIPVPNHSSGASESPSTFSSDNESKSSEESNFSGSSESGSPGRVATTTPEAISLRNRNYTDGSNIANGLGNGVVPPKTKGGESNRDPIDSSLRQTRSTGSQSYSTSTNESSVTSTGTKTATNSGTSSSFPSVSYSQPSNSESSRPSSSPREITYIDSKGNIGTMPADSPQAAEVTPLPNGVLTPEYLEQQRTTAAIAGVISSLKMDESAPRGGSGEETLGSTEKSTGENAATEKLPDSKSADASIPAGEAILFENAGRALQGLLSSTTIEPASKGSPIATTGIGEFEKLMGQISPATEEEAQLSPEALKLARKKMAVNGLKSPLPTPAKPLSRPTSSLKAQSQRLAELEASPKN